MHVRVKDMRDRSVHIDDTLVGMNDLPQVIVLLSALWACTNEDWKGHKVLT